MIFDPEQLTAAKEQVLMPKDIGSLFDHEKLMEAAIERYRAVYRAVMRNRDKLIEAWLAETGIPPSDSMIVEQRMDNGDVRVSVQRRSPEPFYNKLIPDETMLLIENQQKEIDRLKVALTEVKADCARLIEVNARLNTENFEARRALKDATEVSLSLRDRMYKIARQLDEERTR